MAGRRLTFAFPKNYDAGAMGQFLQAIQLTLDDLENRLTGKGGGETSATVTDSFGGAIVVNGVVSNMPIGRGNYFEIIVRSASAVLTGMAGASEGRIVILKNSASSSNSLTIAHESNASATVNRFSTRNGNSLVIPVNGSRSFVYSEKRSAWLPLSEIP